MYTMKDLQEAIASKQAELSVAQKSVRSRLPWSKKKQYQVCESIKDDLFLMGSNFKKFVAQKELYEAALGGVHSMLIEENYILEKTVLMGISREEFISRCQKILIHKVPYSLLEHAFLKESFILLTGMLDTYLRE